MTIVNYIDTFMQVSYETCAIQTGKRHNAVNYTWLHCRVFAKSVNIQFCNVILAKQC